ncbi:alpha/beta fold hydrolase [Luteolibacter flavescens]|uniref:Alpha/beta fold hydrolase n=1 Tax=Luteolibacter flavescens TaxID=1859460 RepID=A0ABT3FUJ1_9BACT|nr:dienelactone hydrolase family protein [Luteolibacter flavescens]MCW1887243.1 alpha/beta fold hydrolase [Luteolibacter flavescens]
MSIHDVSRTLRRGKSLADASGVLILLHGRGADAEDIAGLAGYLPADDLAVLAPQATQFTWYPQRFFVPLEENEPWLSSALALVDQLVSEARAAGIPEERIAIAGFSQGGCLALEYAHRNPRRYGLIAGLSSSLIGPPGVERQPADLQQTPVLVACADHDPHIPLPLVEESVEILSRSNTALTKQIFRGYDHTVFPEEIAWLSERISGWKKDA